MPALPRQIRLAAGDYFMHAQDRRMRQLGLPGNVCCAALRLGQGLDVEQLRQRVAASPLLDWIARARIVRPLGVLPPIWRTVPKPRTLFREHNEKDVKGSGTGVLPPVVTGRALHAGEGPGVSLDLVRREDSTSDLFLSWNHSLLDARGVDMILSHLNTDSAANGACAIQNFIHPRQIGHTFLGWWPNMRMAHGSLKWLQESGREPLFTLMPPGRPAHPSRNHYRLISFNPQEITSIAERCQLLNAGFRRSHFYMAATLRAFHTLAVRRGNKDGAYLVPVPHDTRKRGSKGPIFSNHLSILFYRIEPRHAGNLSDIMGELGRQMTDQIRDRFPECCMAALEMFKPLPLDAYVRRLGKPTQDKFATLAFSDSGEICPGMTELLGAKILDVTHLVPTWRPPGLTVLFLSYNGKPSALLSWVDDCLSPDDVDSLEKDLRFALLEEEVGV
jgi:hypothetical protein